MAGFLLNEGPKWIIFIIWLLGNIGSFIGFFFYFFLRKEWYYLNQILGLSLPLARASASCLNLNSMLILLPVCRNLISVVRGSISCCCRRNIRRQLDKNITFHKICAYMIVIHTGIHFFSHCYNVERFIEAHNSRSNLTRGLLSALSVLPVTQNGSWINPVRNPNTNPIFFAITLVPGYTGILITISLLVIVSSATEVIRRSYFEIFWYTHHLFVVFFVCLAVHGIGGVVRKQINLDAHDPTECTDFKKWGQDSTCAVPQFGPKPAQTWMWILGPMVLYIIERVIRFVRSQQVVKVVKSPQEDYFSVHIRIVGDWTAALAKKYKESGSKSSEELPSLAVDGPFGTASEDVFRYQTVMLVGAGIGVTPFSSILKDIWYRHISGDTKMKTQKIYFVWICPDTNAFEWFIDLLKSVENQMAERGQMDFLEYHLYLTRGVDSDKGMANILVRKDGKADPVTQLQQGTYYGKPDWDAMFKKIAETNEGVRTGVFFCGPKGISTQLHKMSNKYSSSDAKGTAFVYNKENF